MNQQQFEDEPSPLRSQRMTEEEAKAVIDLWQQEEVERGGLTTRPAVPDVAEGLNVTVEDVQRLLQQVRAQRQAEERRFALEQYEVELERIRLAEEERKLAEVQRQRAELQREQAEARRQGHRIKPAPPPMIVRPPKPVGPLPPFTGIIPPAADELAQMTQRETRLRIEMWVFCERALAIIVILALVIALLVHHSR